MSEVEYIADTKFDELLEHIDLGELNIVELSTYHVEGAAGNHAGSRG